MTANHKARHSLSLYSFIYLFFSSFWNQFYDFCSAYVDRGPGIWVHMNALTIHPSIHQSSHPSINSTTKYAIFSIQIGKRETMSAAFHCEITSCVCFVPQTFGRHRFCRLFIEQYTPAKAEARLSSPFYFLLNFIIS